MAKSHSRPAYSVKSDGTVIGSKMNHGRMKSTKTSPSRRKPVVFISTYPTKKSATDVAKQVVKLKLAACVNTVQISSVYSWKGKIESGSEYLSIFKTTMKNKNKLEDHIRTTHPYKVPEIANISMTSVNSAYMKWISDTVL